MHWTRITKTAFAVLGLGGTLLPGAAAQDLANPPLDATHGAPDFSGPQAETSDWTTLEAESLANGKSWVSQPHFKGWYADEPSGDAMLAGYNTVSAADNSPATGIMPVKKAGLHTLWIRLLYSGKHPGPFSVAVEQNGAPLAEKSLDTGDEALVKERVRGMHFEWVPIPLEVKPGTITVKFARPSASSSRLGRNIDLLFLTDARDYKPAIADFRPQLFIRWTNTGQGQPYCLFTYVHRNRDPWFANPGMLGLDGFNKKYGVGSPTRWIGPGQSSPWSNLSPFLLRDGKYNRVQFVATRQSHQEGFVSGEIQGKIEFAGADLQVLKTIEVHQNAPRIWVAVPGDLSRPGAKIETGYDFLQREITALGDTKPAAPAKHLDLVTFLNLQPGVDDPALIDAEMRNLVHMGFNGTYYVVTRGGDAGSADALYSKYGMPERYGMGGGAWFLAEDRDFTRPQTDQIEARFKAAAAANAPILSKMVRMKMVDEPGGPSLASLQTSPTAIARYREYLKGLKLSPADLGAADWDQMVPVTADQKDKQPAAYYYSQLFRLQLAADHAHLLVSLKKKYLPDNVLTHANYSPPFSWVERGVDPFLTQRNGGFEMGWTEDWLGYSAGPEYTSDTYALLRAAGPGQPLGGYMVAASGGALLQRIKYYTMVAAGARQIGVYSYGPGYCDVDSWSEKYDVFPVLRDVQSELANIDEALHGTTRRKAEIAILYNRTAAIWGNEDSSAEQDARFIRWALSHAGYDADIIPEEDIVAGKLENYKVLYMDGIQLRADAAAKIAGWVRAGGVLFGGAGAGTRDELNRPATTLESVFGSKSLGLQTVAQAGRPKFELRGLAALDIATGPQGLKINQLCYREDLEPAGATALLKDGAGKVLATTNSAGKGTATRAALLPGLAYINTAVRGENYNPNLYLPKNFDMAQRDFLAAPAKIAKVVPVAQSNLKSGEIVRYDAPGRSVLFVIDYAGEVHKDFTMLIPDAAWATGARCADGAAVQMTREASALRVSFPLNVAGAIVLESGK